jgi:hypothetical protein
MLCLNSRIFRKILSIPQNTVMNMNNDSILWNILPCIHLNLGIFHIILSIPQNIVMKLNNVMSLVNGLIGLGSHVSLQGLRCLTKVPPWQVIGNLF